MGYIVKVESKSGKTIRWAGASGAPPVAFSRLAHVFECRFDAERAAQEIRGAIPAECTVTVERG